MHTHPLAWLSSAIFPYCSTVQEPLPTEWCYPQWDGPSLPMSINLRQLLNSRPQSSTVQASVSRQVLIESFFSFDPKLFLVEKVSHHMYLPQANA